MAWTSTRLAFLGAFLLASIVSVIALGQRELSKTRTDDGEISIAAYPDQSVLVPAGFQFRDHKSGASVSKTSLAFEQNKPVIGHGMEPRFVKL